MVKYLMLMVLLCAEAWAGTALAGEWKPAAGPLMTRWAKDVSPQKVLPEYPRPQMVRKDWLNLNGLWQFAAAQQLDGPPLGKDLSDQILVPFCMESALSGVGKHADHAWYRRTFKIPADWKNQRVLLHFGAVDYESSVWVNGKKIGSHTGGYDAFTFDVTDALKVDGEQEIVVGVTDTTADTQPRGKQTNRPGGIFYTPCSGIWQTVWIEPVPGWFIGELKITPDVDTGSVRVDVTEMEPSPPAHPWSTGRVAKVDVLDGDKVVAEVWAGERAKIPSPHLWSPEDPYLYHLKVTLGDDSVESYFGLRKIDVAPDEKGIPRIRLNNEPIMQVGPLDQGFWPDGIYTAPTDDAMKYDLEVLKKLGFNMLRKHVKVEPQRYYYWCDKLGLLVWQDMPSAFANKPGEWQKEFEAEMKQMIEQHANSPCIVTWVPFNEGWGQEAYGKEGTTRVANMIKQLDPTRLVDDASGWTDAGAGDMHDIHVYPGPAAPPVEKKRAVVLGEFGGLGLGVDGHTWEQKTWGYQTMASKAELTDKYVRLLGRLWDLHDSAGLCAGVYTQTTDLESECNGLMTYDRAVLKVDPMRVREANLGKGPRVTVQTIIPTARDAAADWKYTFSQPLDGWQKPSFDDSSWKTGPGGFGTESTPGATVRTTWNTPDIWLRRIFDLPADAIKDVELLVHHDEDCEIFINGIRAVRLRGFTADYTEQPLRDAARAAHKPGRNLIAIHCTQTTGGQFIDLGFARLVEAKKN